MHMAVLGLKSDEPPQVTDGDIAAFEQARAVKAYKVSAKSGENVPATFAAITAALISKPRLADF